MESDRDPDAFATFYRRHAGRLLSHFTERTSNPRLAAELLGAPLTIDYVRLNILARAPLS